MNYKSILVQALNLVKAYMASKRGAKQVTGVANLFSCMVVQLDNGINELEAAKESISARIDELTFEMDEQDNQIDAASNLRCKLKELTA